MKRAFNRSVATIDKPEFINVTSINPLISECEVKVLYVGENRNKSLITKEVARNMAETLPGCPIVGYYRTDKEDFFDHGDILTIDGDGIKFSDATRPYGFVAPNAKIWFQKFIDTDENGVETEREYLMTTAFLWTGSYPECEQALNNNNPQSMKLEKDSLKGNWAKTENSNVEFFIINDAIIQNLCILGNDIEPCFEGANISEPDISANFSKEDKVTTLFTMMEQLKELLTTQKEEGGQSSMSMVEETKLDETSVENFSKEQDKTDETVQKKNENTIEEFKKQCEEEKPSDNKEDESKDNKEEKSSDNKDEKDSEDKNEDEDKKKNENFELLQSEFDALQAKYTSLEESYNELVAFKKSIEDKQKDELIQSFYMLSDEDKKDVIENKSNYSLDDIEKELSVICVRKKVNFNLDDDKEDSKDVSTTFNLDSLESDSDLPAWLKAVESTAKKH